MVRILIVIAVVFAWVFIRFLVAYNKQRNAIAAKGGIKTIYKPLIDGLLEYRSAQIIQDKKDFITIGGTFTDPVFNRECGLWTVIIQPTFKLLNVKYQAHIDLGGGETAKQMWLFLQTCHKMRFCLLLRKRQMNLKYMEYSNKRT